jgi:hypothetical protein
MAIYNSGTKKMFIKTRNPRSKYSKSNYFRKHVNTLTCQECGGEYISLFSHVRQIHNLGDYKRKYNKQDRDLFTKDLLEDMGKFCYHNTHSDNAIKARDEYWANPKNKREKGEWMKEELKRRLEDPVFSKKWDNRESVRRFKEKARQRFLKADKDKICVVCGHKFKPSIYFDRGYFKHRTRRTTCSKKCASKLMIITRGW